MVIAALITFATLLAAWLLAPGAPPGLVVELAEPEVLAEAA